MSVFMNHMQEIWCDPKLFYDSLACWEVKKKKKLSMLWNLLLHLLSTFTLLVSCSQQRRRKYIKGLQSCPQLNYTQSSSASSFFPWADLISFHEKEKKNKPKQFHLMKTKWVTSKYIRKGWSWRWKLLFSYTPVEVSLSKTLHPRLLAMYSMFTMKQDSVAI